MSGSYGTGQPGPRAGAALWAPGGPGGRDRGTLWGGGFLLANAASAALLFSGAVGFDDAAASAFSAAVRGGTSAVSSRGS